MDKLTEPRVRRVIAPILEGGEWSGSVSADDLEYVVDLGFVVAQRREAARITNEIYREVISQVLTSIIEKNREPSSDSWWR